MVDSEAKITPARQATTIIANMTEAPLSQPSKTPTEITHVSTVAPTAPDFAVDSVSTLDGLVVKIQQLGPPFIDVFTGYLNSTPLAIADTNGDGLKEIIVAMLADESTDSPPWAEAWTPLDFRRHPTLMQWDGTSYQRLPLRWVTAEEWDYEKLAYIGHVYVADINGDSVNEVALGLTAIRPSYDQALFVFRFDQSDSTYASIYEEQTPYAPVSFSLLQENASSFLLMSDSTGLGISRSSPWTNQVFILQALGKGLQESSILEDKDDTLYAGMLPGHDSYYLIREQAYDPPNLIRAYRVTSGQIIPADNPLPVESNVKSVAIANLAGDGEPFLVLLISNTLCALYSDACYQPSKDYIEVYRTDKNIFSLVSRIEADPDGHSVVRLMVGDLDNDGQDEVLTSTGVIYKWKDGKFRMSRALQDAGQDRWIAWPDDVWGYTLLQPQLIAKIDDMDNDGQNEIVLLAQTQTVVASTTQQSDQSSIFIIKVESP